MFAELHLIQNFAPSNLNRDDNNMPKDAVFGGVRRARVSSQSWKYAIRKSELFKQEVGGSRAMRTSTLITQLRARMAKVRKNEDLDIVVPAFVQAYAGGLGDAPKGTETTDKTTKVMLFIGEDEVDDMAAMLNRDDNWSQLLHAYAAKNVPKTAQSDSVPDQSTDTGSASGKSKKNKDPFDVAIKSLLKSYCARWVDPEKGHSVVGTAEIALFGRMLAAEGNNQSVEAACQLAHAISTHRVEMEMDFFTAIDDRLPSGAQGAGMIGQTDYNSSCYYRYACLDWDQLVTNLKGNSELARKAVKGFLLAFAQVTPSGKQKTFAALNVPDFALATVRDRGMGWSLVNAFETAIRPGKDGGYVDRSIQALDQYYGWIKGAYDDPEKTTVSAEFLLMKPRLPLTNLKSDLEKPITNVHDWAKKTTLALSGIAEDK